MYISRLFDRLSQVQRDILVAALVAAVTMGAISAGQEEGAREPNAWAYLLGVALGAIFLLRRWSPITVLVSAFVISFAYHVPNFPGGPPLIAIWVALFFVAANGQTGAAVGLGVFSVLHAMGWRALVDRDNPLELTMLIDPALTASAVMLGDAMHARRRWGEEVAARLQRAEEEAQHEAQRRVDEERLRIARELHDVLAHTLVVVNVQADVASELIDEDPARTKEALTEMRKASREAMAELRATVGVLRDSGPAPRAPVPGMHDLNRVIEGARQAGIDVVATVQGEPRPVPASVDLAAFRVVQESLTNIVKHAAARSARVLVGYEPTGIVIEVADDGRGAEVTSAGEGFGVRGMRERVEALGGQFEAGPGQGAGFEVRAWLPLRP